MTDEDKAKEDADQAPADGNAPADGGTAETQDPPERPPGRTFGNVYNNFWDKVTADGGTFGLASPGSSESVGRKAQGKLSAAVVTSIATTFAKPEVFGEAFATLRSERMVVLDGRSGTGRRAGGITLLSQVVTKGIFLLSPVITLRELAERDYDRGCGYLVVDRKTEAAAADTEFSWTNIRERVTEQGAYLVVTSARGSGRAASASVRHIPWECPQAQEVLRAQLLGNGCAAHEVETLVQQLIEVLPADFTLTRLVNLARLVISGVKPTDAITRLDDTAGSEVRSWFAESPSEREINEVAVLSFMVGSDVRAYEKELTKLEGLLNKRISDPRKLTSEEVFGDRGARLSGNGLCASKVETMGSFTQRIMVFKDEAYLRFVLKELWETKSTPFWDSVAEWLDELVDNSEGDRIDVASGLAWLARVDFDEVHATYLEPWATGAAGWAGQVTAAYVLWYMSLDESMAAAALQLAVSWAHGGEPKARRQTALVALSGEIGVCYPTEAVNRLWQLTTQTTDLIPEGCLAIARLFVVLADTGPEDAGIVLTMLDRQMQLYGTGDGGERTRAHDLMRLRRITMDSAALIVTLPSLKTRQSAIFSFLQQQPDRLDIVARIWAGLISFWPARREALVALRRGLYGLRELSGEPLTTARNFGRALSQALPAKERQPFKEDLRTVDEQLRRNQTGSPADVIAACLDAITIQQVGKGEAE